MIDTNADANPSIIRTGFEPKNIQISKLNGDSPPDGCIFPSPKHLKSVVNPQDYEGQPYKLCLHLEKHNCHSALSICLYLNSIEMIRDIDMKITTQGDIYTMKRER